MLPEDFVDEDLEQLSDLQQMSFTEPSLLPAEDEALAEGLPQDPDSVFEGDLDGREDA